MASTLGLAHLNLNVSDLGHSVRFYQEVFGLEVVVPESEETIVKDGQPVTLRQAILRTPGARDLLALTHADVFPVGSGGLNHFGFIFRSNADVEVAIAAAVRCGGRILRQGKRDGNGAHEVFAYVTDPDGYAIELSTQEILLKT